MVINKSQMVVRSFSPAVFILWGLLAFSTGSLKAYDDIRFLHYLQPPAQKFEPIAVAATAEGRAFVLDRRTGRIYRFDPSGQLEKFWGGEATKDPGGLKKPGGLAVSGDGRLYVADTGNGRIQVYSQDGDFLFGFGEKGSGPGQLSYPESVFVSHDGVVFVCDTGNARIAAFSSGGVFITQFGQKGKLPGQMLAPSLAVVDLGGNIWVGDRDSKRLDRFTPEGTWVMNQNQSLPISRPSGIATDRFGYLYVSDEDKNKVWEIGNDGLLKGTFGSKGEGRGQFKKLTGCAVDGKGRLFLSDAGNHRVHVFEMINRSKTKEVSPSPSARIYVESLRTYNINAEALGVLPSGDILTIDRKKGTLSRFRPNGSLAWTTEEQKTHPLADPRAILVGPDEKVYISHGKAREIDVWSADGKWEQSFGSEKGEGQLGEPLGLGTNADGKLFVTDGKNAKIQVYGRDGLFLYTVEKTPSFQSPIAVAVQGNGPLYVLEQNAGRISYFDQSGKFMETFGLQGMLEEQLKNPVSLAITKDGDIAVLDEETSRVQAFSPMGEFRWSFGCPGVGKGRLNQPHFMTFDKDGHLWVAEAGRIQEFAIRPVPRPIRDLHGQSSDGKIQLSWSADTSAKEYRVYRSTSGEEPSQRLANISELKWIDSDLFPNLTYYYWVSGVSSSGQESPRVRAEPLMSQARANQPPLEIIDISVSPLFAAYYKYYATHPVGWVRVRNNTGRTYSKVKLGFTLKEFMDFSTETIIDDWPGYQDIERPLVPVFNNRILEITENTPIQAEVKLTYYEDGQERTVVLTKTVTMYERSALTWDDLNHLGAFVTPKDTPVIEYARKTLQPYAQQLPRGPFPQSVMIARLLFESLGANGISYTPDPNNPNLSRKDNPTVVDFIQFPRQTLSRKTGDCDDLTPLYASLAEAVSVETGMADMPGHVMPLINTGETDPDVIGFPEEMFVRIDGELWIPIESTLVGRSFGDAWRESLASLRRWEKEGKVRYAKFHEAWAGFAPVTLPDAKLELEPPKPAAIYSLYGSAWNALLEERLAHLVSKGRLLLSKAPNDTDAMLDIALVYADHRQFQEAEKWLTKAIKTGPNNAAAFNNLGNTAFFSGNYPKAKNLYEKAGKLDPDDDGIELNLCRLALAQSQKNMAQQHYLRALALNPSLADIYPNLSSISSKEAP